MDQARKPARKTLEAILQKQPLTIPIFCLEFVNHVQERYSVFDVGGGCVIDDDYFVFFPAAKFLLIDVICEGVCKLLGVEGAALEKSRGDA